jgi:protein-L-isoaspartate(D-aspartate) O-methyltransferase
MEREGDNGKSEEAVWACERREMVDVLKSYGVRDPRILAAMGKVRRHLFIPEDCRLHGDAYADHARPIGQAQTISQPYIVAYMTAMLRLKPGESVLEIGAGSGYQAAVLAEMGARVFSVEIIPELAQHARDVLAREGYADRVQVLTGNGRRGWPEKAPFDAIVGACAAGEEPKALLDQLKEGGRFIFPVGDWRMQRLVFLQKKEGRIIRKVDLPVQFVPLVKGAG